MIKVEDFSFNPSKIRSNGNKYILGNGYLGYRGTLDEFTKNEYVALNIPHLYDQQPNKWCETVNAPNPFFTYIECFGEKVTLLKNIKEHYQSLSLDKGIFKRKTTFFYNQVNITIESSRFISSDNKHYLGMEYMIKADQDISVNLYTGIDGDIWDLNGPHLENLSFTNDLNVINCYAQTIEKKVVLKITEKVILPYKQSNFTIEETNKQMLRKFSLSLKANLPYQFKKIVFLTYENDKSIDDNLTYEELLKEHSNKFQNRFNNAKVTIEGDDKAQMGANYSIYQLLTIAPIMQDNASIGARGLSGQVYKGAVFWDTEIFMLPFYLLTDNKVARSLINYRISTLDQAIQKAKSFGYEGAFYAWESIRDGEDACTLFNINDVITNRPIRTYFKDKQIHISAAIIVAIKKYYDYTNDFTVFLEGGFDVIIEVARFYYSYLHYHPFIKKYVVLDVTGPDEYHERVNNNAYTNQMVKFCFSYFVEICEMIKEVNNSYYQDINKQRKFDELLKAVNNALSNFVPLKTNEKGVIEQFDGYFALKDISLDELKQQMLNPNEYLGGPSGLATFTQIIKQADVMTMLFVHKESFSKEIISANLNYYLKRTEHGSSLSASIYALTSCLVDKPEIAYPFYLESALIDYEGKAKEFVGDLYIGGTHPAAAGGAYMTLIFGFGGLSFKKGKISLTPQLPKTINRLAFKINYQNSYYQINITPNKYEIKRIDE